MAGNSNSEKKALIKDDLAISILSNSYNRLQRLSSEHTSAADNPIVSQIGYANALPMVGHLHIPWHGVMPRLYARSHPPQKKKLTSTTPLKCWLFVEDLEIPPSHGQPSTTLGNNFECNVAALNLFSYTTSNSFWGRSHFTRWRDEGLNCSSNLMPGDQNNWWCVSPCWQQRTWQPALTAHRSSSFFSSKTRTKRIQKVWIAAVKRTETVYCVLISHRGIPRHHGKARKSHDCHCRSDTQTENRSIYLTWHTSSSQTSTQKKQAQEAKLHPLTLQTIKSFKLIHLKQTCYRFFGLRVFDSKSCAASSSPTKSLELLNRKVPKAPKMQQVPAL